MRKTVSFILAMLMLALPVIGMAEADFASKYLAEGQRMVTDISVQPGSMLLESIPEEMLAAVQDLMQALKIEVTGQSSDGMAQGTLRLLLNDENAADITAAKGEKGLYVASSFLGNKVIQITPEQMKTAMDQLLAQMVEQGALTQEQLDAFQNGLASFQQDPEGTLQALIGTPDFGPLSEALNGLLSMEIVPEQVTELPEEVTIDAKMMVTIPLKKEALENVTTELARLIWSLPVVQQISETAKVNDEPLSEESLIKAFKAFPDLLAEDVEIKVYLTADGSQFQAVSDVLLAEDGNTVPLHLNILAEPQENGTHVAWILRVDAEEAQNMEMTGDMTMVQTEEGGSIQYEIISSLTEEGNTYTNMKEKINAAWTKSENARAMNMDINIQVVPSAEANPVGVDFTIRSEEADLGDHMEANASFSVAVENMGDLLSVNISQKTDLAEAYIITEDAVQPLAMSQEELQAFGEEIMGEAQGALGGLIGKLPQSVLSLVMQMAGSQQE